jgi:hypothetical protein
MKLCRFAAIILLLAATGCGTSKWTDTGRSATEQLLITDAMDRAVSDLEFRALAGKTVFVDSTALKKITDCEYLISCLRQHMLASGCVVKDDKNDADYIVEVRAGAVGTDRHDLLYGVPSVSIPTVVPVSGIPSQIPEIPIIKKTDQRAVVKLSLFAYNQKTGRPVWQSGAVPQESNAKAVWVLGAGPFQRGSIYDGTEFAGNKLNMPLVDIYKSSENHVSVADEAYFAEPKEQVAPEDKVETAVAATDEKKEGKPKREERKDGSASVMPAGHAEPSSGPSPPATPSDSAASAAPPASLGGSPGGATDPPVASAVSSAQTPPADSPNDLAPALAELGFGTEPRLLRIPSAAPETSATPPLFVLPPVSAPTLGAPK